MTATPNDPMRKQYHFRASPAGLRAWDVDRLVQLTRNLPRERVRLADVREIDEPYWSNEGTRQLTCRDVVEHARLMQDCDFDHPVILSRDGRVMVIGAAIDQTATGVALGAAFGTALGAMLDAER